MELTTATKYELFYDDTKTKPWSFVLKNDNEEKSCESKQYKTKAAAASVATRRLNVCPF